MNGTNTQEDRTVYVTDVKDTYASEGYQAVKVYFGRQGCACGCRGQYREGDQLARALHTATMKIRAAVVRNEEVVRETWGDEEYLAWEGDDRAVRIYYKKVA